MLLIPESNVRDNDTKARIRASQNLNEQLEEFTVAYLRGDMTLEDYREKTNTINVRFDLRRIASKLGVRSTVIKK